MTKKNQIEQAILALDGAGFQKLMDSYLCTKYDFDNITHYGTFDGANKPTKGTPDSYVRSANGKYTLIAYGHVPTNPFTKIKSDIEACLNPDKSHVSEEEIEKIICCHTTSNLSIAKTKELYTLSDKLVLIGISDITEDLYRKYPQLTYDYLGVEIDTRQVLDIDTFVQVASTNVFSTSLEMSLLCRDKEIADILALFDASKVVVLTGASGFGKTKLAIHVAKEYVKTNEYTLKVIKSNNVSIFHDLHSHFPDDSNYFVLIDDADQLLELDIIISNLLNVNRTHEIKILITVRDYAKMHVLKQLRPYENTSYYEITGLSKESIYTILRDNLNIVNQDALEQIGKIAKGNVRLAIMAANCALNDDNYVLNNSFDIFNRYFGQITDQMTEKELIVAFLVSFFKVIALEEEHIALEIAEDNGITVQEFKDYCFELHRKEVVEIYDNKAVKVSNQNIRDYVFQLVIFEKKWLAISSLLEISFPRYRDQWVFLFKTVTRLFHSIEHMKFIQEEIKKSWLSFKQKRSDIVESYITAFCQVIPEESLAYISKGIKFQQECHTDIANYDYAGHSNYHYIRSKWINLLIPFKYTEYFEMAISLSCKLMEKYTEYPMDYYFLYRDEWGIDRYSHHHEYKYEILLVETLLKNYQTNGSEESAIALMHAADKGILLDGNSYESADDGDGVIYYTFGLDQSAINYRKACFNAISKLLDNPTYRRSALSTLYNYPFPKAKIESNLSIVKSDFSLFENLISEKLSIESATDAQVLDAFYQLAETCGTVTAINSEIIQSNHVYRIYKTLCKEPISSNWVKRRERISQSEIKNIGKENDIWPSFWYFCQRERLKNSYTGGDWQLSTNIQSLFDLWFSTDQKKFLQCLDSYINNGLPCLQRIDILPGKLISILGIEEALNYINSKNFECKNGWIIQSYIQMPEEQYTCDYLKRILLTVKEKKIFDYQLSITFLCKANRVYSSFIIEYFDILIRKLKKTPTQLALEMNLGINRFEADVLYFIDSFSEDTELLMELYSQCMNQRNSFDYEGELFIHIIKRYPHETANLIRKLVDCHHLSSNKVPELATIWKQDEYEQILNSIMETAYEEVDNHFYTTPDLISSIFSFDEKKEPALGNRRSTWISNHMVLISTNITKLKKFFKLLYACPDSVYRQAIVDFCNTNSDFEVFKVIQMMPTDNYSAWSGSQVPLIEKEIEYFEQLKGMLSGIDFLEHTAYLSEIITRLKNNKDEVIYKEFLERR